MDELTDGRTDERKEERSIMRACNQIKSQRSSKLNLYHLMNIFGSLCVDSGSRFQHKKDAKTTSLVFAKQTKLSNRRSEVKINRHDNVHIIKYCRIHILQYIIKYSLVQYI